MAIVDSVFGDLTKNGALQAIIDDASVELFPTAVWRQNLDVGLPQASLTFESVIGKAKMKAAAALVDPDSPAPKQGRPALETLTGKIPTLKQAYEMKQQDFRAIMALKENSRLSREAVDEKLVEFLSNDLKSVAKATDDRIDIMHIQGYSSFTVDASTINNSNGAVFGEITLPYEAEQIRKVKKVWTDSAADPFQDIEDTVDYGAAIGRVFEKIQIDRATWSAMKKLASVKSTLAGFYNPGSGKTFAVTLSSVNEYLVESKLPYIEVVNYRYGVEKNGIVTPMNPFKAANVVFLPYGKMGTLHNATVIDEWKPNPVKVYANYGPAILSKFMEDNPWCEYTEVEMNAFPGLESINGIMHLKTDEAAA